MRQSKCFSFVAVSIFSLLCISQQSNAARESRSEVNFLIPYALGNNIEFDGGSTAKIHADVGVGFGYAYNYSDKLAYRVDLMWNSGTYRAHRITTEGPDNVIGDLDQLSVLFGTDYYFAKGRVAPYAHFNFGWTLIDSNTSQNPETSGSCWKTPWSAEVCQGALGDEPTYKEKNMVAGLGLGFRFEVARRNFFRVGYYHSWIDFDQASNMEGLGTARLEYGFLY